MAIEIAEAVVGALKGELAATAVNAPMVPSEVLEIKSSLCVYFMICTLLHGIDIASLPYLYCFSC